MWRLFLFLLNVFTLTRIISASLLTDEHRWTISLQAEVINSEEAHVFCRGVLIELFPPVILTAAHCFDSFTLNSVDNTITPNDNGVSQNVFLYADINRTALPIHRFQIYPDHIYIHDEYINDVINENDIALLILSDHNDTDIDINIHLLPTILSNSDNDGVCCSTEDELIIMDTTIGTMDMEYIDTETCMDETLEYLENSNITHEQLQQFTAKVTSFAHEFICTQIDDDIDICNGHGGQALFRYNEDSPAEIVGILSFSPSGCNNEYPLIYTNISEHFEWITNTMDYIIDGVDSSDHSTVKPNEGHQSTISDPTTTMTTSVNTDSEDIFSSINGSVSGDMIDSEGNGPLDVVWFVVVVIFVGLFGLSMLMICILKCKYD